MDPAAIAAFLIAVILISASPGPAMALIFRRAALRGPRSAVHTVLGLEAGIYLWALAAGAGLAAFVAASEVAYTVLRVHDVLSFSKWVQRTTSHMGTNRIVLFKGCSTSLSLCASYAPASTQNSGHPWTFLDWASPA